MISRLLEAWQSKVVRLDAYPVFISDWQKPRDHAGFENGSEAERNVESSSSRNSRVAKASQIRRRFSSPRMEDVLPARKFADIVRSRSRVSHTRFKKSRSCSTPER